MKKVLHKVFGSKEDRELHDTDITHIGGVEEQPLGTTTASSSTTGLGTTTYGDTTGLGTGLSSEPLLDTSTLSTTTTPLSTGVISEQPLGIQRPEVVQEFIKPVETEVVQPVVHRERVQTEVKQVTQPIYEKDVLPTTSETKVLPAQYTETVVPSAPIPAVTTLPSSTTIVGDTEKRVLYKEPVVQETIKHQLVEEVQPVIYREVEQHHVIQTEQPVYERVVEAPRVISEQRNPIERT